MFYMLAFTIITGIIVFLLLRHNNCRITDTHDSDSPLTFDESLEIFNQLKNELRTAKSRNEHDKAIYICSEILKLSQRAKELMVADEYIEKDIGQVYERKKDWKNALEHYKKALNLLAGNDSDTERILKNKIKRLEGLSRTPQEENQAT